MAVSPFLYKVINNRELIAANITDPSLPNSLLVQPYAVIQRRNYVQINSQGLATYVYPDTENQSTMLWYELTANHTYLVLADVNPGTRFRWIKSSEDISNAQENVSCEAVYSADNPPAYLNFFHIITQHVDNDDTNAILRVDKYLGGYVDSAGNYNTRAYVLDITSLV